jgi:hypothetical protein
MTDLIEELRSDVNHLVQPIIGHARLLLADADSRPFDWEWLVQRLYVLLDVFENATGNPVHRGLEGDVIEAYRFHGMSQRRAEGIAAVQAERA